MAWIAINRLCSSLNIYVHYYYFIVTEVTPGTQWIAVRLPWTHKVTGVTTQGRPIGSGGHLQWVTSFNLQYSDDGTAWTYVTEAGQTKV